MIKQSIQEEDIKTVNIYAPNTEGPQYIRQINDYQRGQVAGRDKPGGWD